MKDDKKSSIIKEALTDYKEIMDAADANAKKKLAEEFPEKFQNLLKEELQNKNKSKKESYKKLDDTEESEKDDNTFNKESVMKNQEKETKKVVKEKAGEGKPFGEKPKEVANVKEAAGEGKPFVEKSKEGKDIVAEPVQETAGEGKPFGEKAKEGKDIVAEPVEEDVKITDTVGDGDPFDQKAKKAQKVEEGAGKGKPFDKKAKKLIPVTEEFDITDLDVDSAGTALESADEDDELFTMDDIEKEISEMEDLNTELGSQQGGGVPYQELVEMRNKLNEMIKNLGVDEMHQAGQSTFGDTGQVGRLHNDGPTDQLIDEKPVDEMHQGNFPLDKMHSGNYDDSLIDEESPITDADIEAVLGRSEDVPVDEQLGITHANNKKVTATHPRFEYKPESHKQHTRSAVQSASGMVTGIQESKKVAGLIEDNKKLTKRVNEVKKFKVAASKLMEGYKTALEKYRNQLKEMAIFNTNLAHVNNLLVNEELALTQDDKIKIINEFKKVDSIAESQKKYKAVLAEMKEGKKTLTESIERKAAASIQPSSKQKLDEVVEKTAYADDEHIKRMKKLIEYVEHRGKKNNL
jgi:hypothetical protein